MRISVKADEDINKIVDDMGKRIKDAFRNGVTKTTVDWKNSLRNKVRSAGLGNRLPNAISAKIYPKPSVPTFNPVGFISFRTEVLFRVFTQGAVIRSSKGMFLAIPTENAPKQGIGGKRISPSNFPEHVYGPLQFIYRKGRPSLLIVNNARVGQTGRVRSNIRTNRAGGRYTSLAGRQSVVMFILVPQVTIRKRFDLDEDRWHWLNRLFSDVEYELYKKSHF